MSRRPGFVVHRQMRRLDAVNDSEAMARLSLVTLHGNPTLTHALFTVAFLKQVAVPTMARILYRRGTGDIVRFPGRRNADTLTFFAQLLDNGPSSPTGEQWIRRLNHIHSHFPIRNEDSLYTLATLALDPHKITSALARSPFGTDELESHWQFWRAVALRQHISGIPDTRAEMQTWTNEYEKREFAPSPEGRAIADSLISAFGERVLPESLRHLSGPVISAVSPLELRRVHCMPDPTPTQRRLIGAAVLAYSATTKIRPVDLDRTMMVGLGLDRYGEREPDEVGYDRTRARRSGGS